MSKKDKDKSIEKTGSKDESGSSRELDCCYVVDRCGCYVDPCCCTPSVCCC